MKLSYLYYLEYLALVFIVIYTFISFYALPELIPTHYNFFGVPDAYGDRSTIFMFPCITIITYIILWFINKATKTPNSFLGFPEKYTNKQIKILVKATAYLRFTLVMLFSYGTYASIQVSLTHWATIGIYFVSSIIIITLVFVAYILISLYRTLD